MTDYALDWLDQRESEKPFFLYISHKAVHSDFVARDSERGMYQDKPWDPPATYPNTPENRAGKPRWLLEQRNSRHGVDYGYNLDTFNLEFYYKRYCEALKAVDDNVGRVLEYLDDHNPAENTLVVYMGDNGFQLGEHGLIDKRTAYEASIRVPLLMYYPGHIQPGSKVREVVANIDIGPTLMETAGAKVDPQMDGSSFWKLALGEELSWRENLLYEF